MTALIIANTQIRRDAAGRYCLNDLHQASGGAKRHQPSDWMRRRQTQELVAEIVETGVGLPESGQAPLREFPEAPVVTVNDGFANGTYAVKELVYAYAMWISAAFHLHVIRAYDALQTAASAEPAPGLLPGPQHRADQLVSAGRIFNAALRVARSLRLTPEAAIASAAHCAARHTGIDWPAELGVPLPEPEAAAALPTGTAARLDAFLADRTEVTLAEVSAATGLGRPDVPATHKPLAAWLRARGWHSRRTRTPANTFTTVWARALHS